MTAGENQHEHINPGGRLTIWLATGLGLGYSPIAPGTVGAVWGLPLAWGIGHIDAGAWGGGVSVGIQIAAIVFLGLVGVPICDYAARRLGRPDPGAVVWDEIASMPITFLFVPWDKMTGGTAASVMLAGFLLHRIFDISKPPPCRQAERLHGGLGIMADDWIAAAYAGLVLHTVLWLTGTYPV